MSKPVGIPEVVKTDSQIAAAADLVAAAYMICAVKAPESTEQLGGLVAVGSVQSFIQWLHGVEPGHTNVSQMFREMEARMREDGYIFRPVNWEKKR